MPLIDEEILTTIDDTVMMKSLPMVRLFALRIVLHDGDPSVDLEQDINDLTYFPERLISSHKDEWVTYCRKHLFMECKRQGF